MAEPAQYAAAVVERALCAADRQGRWLPTVGLDLLERLNLDHEVNLEAVLARVVEEVAQRLDADRGTLYLLDHARQELVSRVAHLPELSEIRLRLGEGVAGWVAQSGQPVNLDELDERFNPRIDHQTGYHTRSMLVVPVKDQRRRVVAVLQLLNKRVGRFDRSDSAKLLCLADDVAAILARTSLSSQLDPDSPRSLVFGFNHIVGESAPMQEVMRRVSRAARADATVLVRGESGAGKEAIARAVHYNSARSERPFVKVDCAALPAQLIENELFGHERGAFTGADRATDGKVHQADGGTLFLDEVGELPLAVQGKLLRLLQDRMYHRVGGTSARRVDLRFVCATHRDLETAVREGRFRQDLYYRLRVVEIDVPALRKRGSVDIDRLIDHFFFKARKAHGRPELRLTADARAALHRHDWPGNVRELSHCIEAAVVLAPGPALGSEALNLGPTLAEDGLDRGSLFTTEVRSLRAVERAYVEHVLSLCDGNRSEAARRLGIGRNTLLRKLSPPKSS